MALVCISSFTYLPTHTSTTAPAAASGVKHVLMDIEGTTTSISFVHDTLFPYAAQAVEGHLRSVCVYNLCILCICKYISTSHPMPSHDTY